MGDDDFNLEDLEDLEEEDLELEKPDEAEDVFEEVSNIKKHINIDIQLGTLKFEESEDMVLYNFSSGFSAYEEENFYSAIECFSLALEIDDEYVDAYHYRGLCFCELKKYQKGISDFTKAILYSQKYDYEFLADIYYDRGIAYCKLDSLESALEDFNKSIQLAPDIIHSYFALGCIFNQQNKYEKALEYLENGIKYFEGESFYKKDFYKGDILYYEAGKSNCKIGYLEKAYECFKKAKSHSPENEKILRSYLKIKKILDKN